MDTFSDYWENITVGHMNLDHSENYFERHHSIDKENSPNVNNANIAPNQWVIIKELRKLNIQADATNRSEAHSSDATKRTAKIAASSSTKPSNNFAVTTNPPVAIVTPMPSVVEAAANNPGTTTRAESERRRQPIREQPLRSRPTSANREMAPTVTTNNVARYATIYQEKKKRQMEKVLQQEKLMRKFNSKPAPNFSAVHQKLDREFDRIRRAPTYPNTPRTLLASQNAAQLRKQRIDEWNRKQAEIPPFIANPAVVLGQSPYRPILDHREIQPEPFQLRMSERLRERREYDLNYERMCEEKRLKEESEKAAQEKILIKQLRKEKEFKARRNPFA